MKLKKSEIQAKLDARQDRLDARNSRRRERRIELKAERHEKAAPAPNCVSRPRKMLDTPFVKMASETVEARGQKPFNPQHGDIVSLKTCRMRKFVVVPKPIGHTDLPDGYVCMIAWSDEKSILASFIVPICALQDNS